MLCHIIEVQPYPSAVIGFSFQPYDFPTAEAMLLLLWLLLRY